MAESYTSILENSGLKKHVLNEKNILINKTFIENVLNKFGLKHKVKSLDNFQLAMIHKSYIKSIQINEKLYKLYKEITPLQDNLLNKVLPLQNKSYESLEYLGDAVIHLILANYLYKRYDNKDPGFLTVLRTKIEKGETLSKLSKHIGLDKYAIIARNIELAGGRQNNKNIMEDIFEAFMGALSLETTFENCRLFLTNLIDEKIDFAELINTSDNYKELLMQHYHKLGFKTTPTYKLLEMTEDKKKTFIMGAYDPNNKLIGTGIASSKRVAAENAAKEALIKFKVINNNIKDEEDDDVYEILD
jgi:dsRNA-specific ribonuclease